ncbi:hypothetical protein O0555_21420 [Brevibacillus laterosporus]|uniref:hypothetical protein n=1 Tax=Brevibacillus laterosporus TaxID=1465 RepID=UPI00215D223C|nr:hypothetical protein [Brevibacillus laterosporus]MCR8939864.1 hypothetical protein [Brevibacillus laterosporus]MCZ0842504.1 hypothetical protein [Brevibacillus laterosporus]MCZ0847869.1 hypothetical protein [Brevibacillus laterosporus]
MLDLFVEKIKPISRIQLEDVQYVINDSTINNRPLLVIWSDQSGAHASWGWIAAKDNEQIKLLTDWDSYTIRVDQIVDIVVSPNLDLIDWLWTEDEFYYAKTNKD